MSKASSATKKGGNPSDGKDEKIPAKRKLQVIEDPIEDPLTPPEVEPEDAAQHDAVVEKVVEDLLQQSEDIVDIKNNLQSMLDIRLKSCAIKSNRLEGQLNVLEGRVEELREMFVGGNDRMDGMLRFCYAICKRAEKMPGLPPPTYGSYEGSGQGKKFAKK